MTPEFLATAALVIPILGAVAIAVFGNSPNLRETATLATAALLFLVVLELLVAVVGGARPELHLLEMFPGLSLSFSVEPLGMLFATIASGLWIVNSIYSIGYMRGNNEPRQTTFYICFALAIFSAIGIAFSGNLLTLFLFYEVLTLSTYPLVTHKANDDARRGGRIYLLILLGTSMVLLLPAIIWTFVLTGTTEFRAGGILDGKVSGAIAGVLLGLFVFGVGKAALMPFHRWLPNAMVAPTPVSALLHAVAVVKAGVFSVMKIVVYIFGIDFLAGSGQNEWLIYVAGATILLASFVAMTKDNLKARLAYSTIGQLGYVVLGAVLANSMGVLGGSMHIAMHAMGKITLFFCAGAIYTAMHKTEISDLAGLGRAMPLTFAAFAVGSLSIIGLPPFGGLWGKWYLVLGALDAQQMTIVAILLISSVLNVMYLLPIPFRAFFGKPPADGSGDQYNEAPVPCLIAIGITSLGCLLLFLFPEGVYDLVRLVPLR